MKSQPTLFLSHGSPMTAIDAGELGAVWQALGQRLHRPDAVLMVSAHWTTGIPMLGGAAQPETVHDFGGFDDALYRIRYPAPGAPQTAERVKALLGRAGLAAGLDPRHGLDHGAWVPLLYLFPEADVPVLQLSVQPDRCARHHHSVGRALARLAEENVLVVGSGHMTHNLRDYFVGKGALLARSSRFRDWADERLRAGDTESLLDWQHAAPEARVAHPTPEHFLPLFVALGAAGPGSRVEALGGGTIGGALAADNYLFARDAGLTAH